MLPPGRNDGASAKAPADKPPTTVAISANLRLDRSERRGCWDPDGKDERSGRRNINIISGSMSDFCDAGAAPFEYEHGTCALTRHWLTN